MTSVQDQLTHILDYSDAGEPSGTWTGLACPNHGLPAGADVDAVPLRQLPGLPTGRPDLGDTPQPRRPAVPTAIRAFDGGRAEAASGLTAGPHSVVSGMDGHPRRPGARPARGRDQVSWLEPQCWVMASSGRHFGPYGVRGPHVTTRSYEPNDRVLRPPIGTTPVRVR